MNKNLEIWDQLGRTDPDHTKGFKRAGGFSGTAIKPIYTEKKMTELFGPCGVGWGFTEPRFEVVQGDNKEVLVFCWLSLWITHDGNRSLPIPGVGGDKIVTHIKANPQYNRPERWENDDEAFKKAFTDAIGNAMKHIGMSADVHMGLFEDSKYLKELRDELAANQKAPADDTSAGPDESTIKYVEMALFCIANAKNTVDLKKWWADEGPNRQAHAIVNGTPEYKDLYAAFVERGKFLATHNHQEKAA